MQIFLSVTGSRCAQAEVDTNATGSPHGLYILSMAHPSDLQFASTITAQRIFKTSSRMCITYATIIAHESQNEYPPSVHDVLLSRAASSLAKLCSPDSFWLPMTQVGKPSRSAAVHAGLTFASCTEAAAGPLAQKLRKDQSAYARSATFMPSLHL